MFLTITGRYDNAVDLSPTRHPTDPRPTTPAAYVDHMGVVIVRSVIGLGLAALLIAPLVQRRRRTLPFDVRATQQLDRPPSVARITAEAQLDIQRHIHG